MQKALADFSLEDVEQMQAQHDANVAAAIADHNEFERAAKYIDPLLREHPGWVWRDAVNHLRDSGKLEAIGLEIALEAADQVWNVLPNGFPKPWPDGRARKLEFIETRSALKHYF